MRAARLVPVRSTEPVARHAGELDGPAQRRGGPPAAGTSWDVGAAAVGAEATASAIGADVCCVGRVGRQGECGEHREESSSELHVIEVSLVWEESVELPLRCKCNFT